MKRETEQVKIMSKLIPTVAGETGDTIVTALADLLRRFAAAKNPGFWASSVSASVVYAVSALESGEITLEAAVETLQRGHFDMPSVDNGGRAPEEGFDGSIKTVRLKLIEIAIARALKEIKRRGYSAPKPELKDTGYVLHSSCVDPGLLPGFTFSPDDLRGICYCAADWTGYWEVWGWDADGKYWQVDRKVRRAEALAAIRREVQRFRTEYVVSEISGMPEI